MQMTSRIYLINELAPALYCSFKVTFRAQFAPFKGDIKMFLLSLNVFEYKGSSFQAVKVNIISFAVLLQKNLTIRL